MSIEKRVQATAKNIEGKIQSAVGSWQATPKQKLKVKQNRLKQRLRTL